LTGISNQLTGFCFELMRPPSSLLTGIFTENDRTLRNADRV
jgi:hypothetical protein